MDKTSAATSSLTVASCAAHHVADLPSFASPLIPLLPTILHLVFQVLHECIRDTFQGLSALLFFSFLSFIY